MTNFQVKYYFIFLIFFLIAGIIFLTAPLNFLINFAHDDSFFYLKTAGNITDGRGITFDGLGPTNGYHPLYLFLVTAYFGVLKLFSLSAPETLFRMICIFHLFIMTLTLLFVYKFFQSENSGILKITSFAFLSLGLIFIRDFGLESHISCLLFSIYIYLKFGRKQSRMTFVLTAPIPALIFLTRTDYLWSLIPFMLIPQFIPSGEKTDRKGVFTELIVTVFAAVIYYSSNLIYFGNIQQVSSIVVNAYPSLMLYENIRALFSEKGYVFNQTLKILIISGLLLGAAFSILKRGNPRKNFLLFATFGLFLNLLAHIAFNRYNVREWYVTFPLFVSLYLPCVTFNVRNNIYYKSAAYASASIFIFVFLFSRVGNTKWVNSYDYAEKITNFVAEKENVYQFDYSGLVSFFSKRDIVNGDGLVNSFEYLEYLKSSMIPQYIRKKNIKYVSTIEYGKLETDGAGNIVLRNEPFLNGLNLKKTNIVYSGDFIFKSPLKNINGSWYLIKTCE